MIDRVSSKSICVIALHGNGGGGYRFHLAKPHFMEKIEFVAPTLPGFGDLSLPSDFSSLEDYADHLQELLKDKSEPIVLVGHGIGGSIALEYCRKYSSRIEGLVLHTPVGAKLKSRLFPRLMRIFGVTEVAKMLIAFPALQGLWKRLFFKANPPATYCAKFFSDYGRCQAFSLMFELIDAAWFDSLPQFPKLKATILWGAGEKLLGEEQIDEFLTKLPLADVNIVDGWGHFPMVDCPEEYASYLSKAVERLVEMPHESESKQ